MRIFKRAYRPQSRITQVKKSGWIGKSQYVVFDDGVVVIETPKGVHRFSNPQELVSHTKALRPANQRPFLRVV